MTLDGLLTFAGLVIAAYAIVPAPRWMAFRLHWAIWDWLIIVFAVGTTHYLLFYPFFVSLGLGAGIGLSRYGVTPGGASYSWMTTS